jgi:hypothetical protein
MTVVGNSSFNSSKKGLFYDIGTLYLLQRVFKLNYFKRGVAMKNSLLVIIFVQFLCYSQFAGGSGTAEDPWLIRTPENLDSIRYFLGAENEDKYFKQIADIDLRSPWNEGKGWDPIGAHENEFTGYFDGNSRYYRISFLTINDYSRFNVGLFGVVKNAEINHVHIEGVDIKGYGACGALVGSSLYSVISNCSAEFGNVLGIENEIGGLIGNSISDSISCCFSNIDVQGIDHVGGFIGLIFGGTTVVNSYSHGNVTGFDYVGGLIGVNDESSILNCYSTGYVSGNYLTGGLTAGFSSSDVTLSYWDIETSGQLTSVGGDGRMTEDMTYPYSDSTYVDWNFEDIWIIGYPTKSMYPILRWQTYVSIENDNSIPAELKLFQNYPNPFNPATEISFAIKEKGNVKLTAYNSKGELVKVLFEGLKGKGMHIMHFDASGLDSGIYFYRLDTEDNTITRKMLYLK